MQVRDRRGAEPMREFLASTFETLVEMFVNGVARLISMDVVTYSEVVGRIPGMRLT